MRRELWQTVTDLTDALPTESAEALGLRVSDVAVTLPVEVVLPRTAAGFRVYVDAPRSRWTPGVRDGAGRLSLSLHHVPVAAVLGDA